MLQAPCWAKGRRKTDKAAERLPLCSELSGLPSPFRQSSLHVVYGIEGDGTCLQSHSPNERGSAIL